jgi:hypothetical protein
MDIWVYCASCRRWFYVAVDPADVHCPVCVCPPTLWHDRADPAAEPSRIAS